MTLHFEYNKENAELALKFFGMLGAFLAAWSGIYFSVDAVKTKVTGMAQHAAVWAVPAAMIVPALSFMVYIDPYDTTRSKIWTAILSGIIPTLLLATATLLRVLLIRYGPNLPARPTATWGNGAFWALLVAVAGFELLFWQQALDLFTALLGNPH